MEKNLPVYELTLGDEEQFIGVYANSFVSAPAIEVDFVHFKKEQDAMKFKAIDGEKRLVYGPLMIPDKLIYRKDETRGEHYVKFTPDIVEQSAHKFMKRGLQDIVTVEHLSFQVEGAVMVETWLTGENDKSKELGFDLPKNTWFACYEVLNNELWDDVKAGNVRGFSVEAMYQHVIAMESQKTDEERFLEEFEKLCKEQ